MRRTWSFFVYLCLVCGGKAYASDVETLRSELLTDFPGQEVQMFTVSYKPGEFSPPHRHNAHVFVYMLEGRVEMQVGEAVQLEPGDTFYETPDSVHRVSRNLSDTEGARFLVFMIKAAGAPTTEPVPHKPH